MNNLALCLHSQLLADHCILLLYTVIYISLKNYLWEIEKMFNVKSKNMSHLKNSGTNIILGPWIPDYTRVVDSRNDLLEYSIYLIMTKKTFLYQKWTWCEYWFKWFSSVRNHSKFFSRLTLFGHREVSLSIDYLTDYP